MTIFPQVLFVPHHLSHAAASFYPSPFEKASVLTLDGVGEWTTGTMGSAKDHKITLTDEMRFPHSVGLLYSAFTAYLGFEVNDGEYKVMGMAGYGKPIHINKIKKLFSQNRDGSIRLNLDYFSFHRSNSRMYTDVFIIPAAGDDGAAVGAALYVYHHVLGNKKRFPLTNVFLGQEYTVHTGTRISDAKLLDLVSDQFRPFVPVILAEHAKKYFPDQNANLSRFMLATYQATAGAKTIAAATTHVDDTSRIQIVERDCPGNYRKLLERFYQKTKRPILLNTSFNLKGEPIVETPADALKTFSKMRRLSILSSSLGVQYAYEFS